MKVIDLINRIANGKEIPKKIKWGGFELEWEELIYHDYKFLETGNHLMLQGFATSVLNDEVEVIGEKEKDRKIRKIKVNYSPDIEEKIFYEDGDKPNHSVLGDAGTELLINKINEIIDYINGGTND